MPSGRIWKEEIGLSFWTSPILGFSQVTKLEIENLTIILQDPCILRCTNTQEIGLSFWTSPILGFSQVTKLQIENLATILQELCILRRTK